MHIGVLGCNWHGIKVTNEGVSIGWFPSDRVQYSGDISEDRWDELIKHKQDQNKLIVPVQRILVDMINDRIWDCKDAIMMLQ